MTAAEELLFTRAEAIVKRMGDNARDFRRYGRPRGYWRRRIADFLWRLFE